MYSNSKSLLVCYISGLDLRRVNHNSTPFLSAAFKTYPWVKLKNLPSNELFPTLITGVGPSEHGVWGVKLNQFSYDLPRKSVSDLLPDIVTTSFQGLLHLLTSNYDLAAVPPQRRRRFDITRTKYKRRAKKGEAFFCIGDIPTIFDIIGGKRCRYIFSSKRNLSKSTLPRLCLGQHVLEMFELYSLDRYQQWNLNRLDKVLNFYKIIDSFLCELNDKCKSMEYSMMIVSDHGHEPISESINLVSELSALNLPTEDYTYFIEVSSARFWFHSITAKRKIMSLLSTFKQGTLLTFNDMHRYGIPLRDESYGEVFLYLNPGRIFFPHDFHHPLGNLWLGVTDKIQRSRLSDPRHKGNHGHLPNFDAENSFVIFIDDNYETTNRTGSILDIAPTILSLLNCEPLNSMKGTKLFHPRNKA